MKKRILILAVVFGAIALTTTSTGASHRRRDNTAKQPFTSWMEARAAAMHLPVGSIQRDYLFDAAAICYHQLDKGQQKTARDVIDILITEEDE